MRIAVIGSCTTRDLWTADTNPPNLLFFGRTSLASVIAPRFAADLAGLTLTSDWQIRAVTSDVDKTILRQIELFEPQVLIVDLINERYDLFRVRGSIVTYSREFVCGGGPFLPWARDGSLLSRLSASTQQLWEQSVKQLVAFVRSSAALKSTRVVLHRAPWATTYCEGQDLTAEQHALPEYADLGTGQVVLASRYAAMLQSLYDRFSESFSDLEQIEVDPAFHVGGSAHRWGLGPFHYVSSYYEDCRQKMLDRGIRLFDRARSRSVQRAARREIGKEQIQR